MDNEKLKNVIKNFIISFIIKILTLILNFILRFYFIKFLGINILGISSVFSNVINWLSMLDFGIYTAMIFLLYKLVHSDDKKQISNVFLSFSKIYKIIAIMSFLIGVLCSPLIKIFIKDVDISYSDIFKYYYLYLFNTSLSYLIISRNSLLMAYRKGYITSVITGIISMFVYFFQILFLNFNFGYDVYLIIAIFGTIFNYVLLLIITNKMFPFLINNKENLNVNSLIKAKTKDAAIYKIGNLIINSTDNILISLILGTTVLGIYANYLLIMTTITAFLMLLINSLLPNIGAIYSENNSHKLFKSFNLVSSVFSGIAIIIFICLYFLMQDFMRIWLSNEQMLLSNFDVIIICLFAYTECYNHPLWMYRESIGMFSKIKILILVTAILNIILSIILGNFLGLAGILFATILSKIFTIYWLEPLLLYKKYFKQKIFKYLCNLIKYLFINSLLFCVCYLINVGLDLLLLQGTIVNLLFKGISFILLVLIVYFFIIYKSYIVKMKNSNS